MKLSPLFFGPSHRWCFYSCGFASILVTRSLTMSFSSQMGQAAEVAAATCADAGIAQVKFLIGNDENGTVTLG